MRGRENAPPRFRGGGGGPPSSRAETGRPFGAGHKHPRHDRSTGDRIITTPFEDLPPPEDLQRRISEIFALTDMVPDVDLEGDIAWMQAERDRRGQPQPDLPAQE